MLRDVTLGQYFPGDSLLHRLDPRIKILSGITLIVAVFLAKNAAAFALLLLFTLGMILCSRIPGKTIFGGLKAIAIVIALTTLLNLFFTKGEGIPLFQWGPLEIYTEGIWYTAFIFMRIITLLILTSLVLTYTTSPVDLTGGIERLLSPLKKIGLPIHEFAMMMTTALRFIPTLIEETDRIMSAQKSRGADFSSGNLLKRVKALIPVLIPLLISAFRRALELADAMECRCYRGGKGRTRMKELKLDADDILFFLSTLLLIAGVVVLNQFAPFGYQMH